MKSPADADPDPKARATGAADPAAEFADLAGACVSRFLRQEADQELPAAVQQQFLARLWAVVKATGLPRPLTVQEQGEPAEMPAERAASLAAQVFAGLACPERHADLEVPARQLLKACLNPEFRACRDSYREVVDGVCRRQELARTRGRLSGAHCVDCPYWVALRPEQHAALLAREWVAGDVAEFAAHHEIFLPEDFRALKVFLGRRTRTP